MTFPNNDLNSPMLLEFEPDHREVIVNTPFDQMVTNLAKPGEAIKETLKFSGFLHILQLSCKIIDKGNELDALKKQVVYNKPASAVPDVVYARLPSSQGLAQAFDELDADKLHMLHMAIGLAGEAAEMLEAVVKHILGGQLDGENIREEAGDATFYIVGLLNGIETHMEEALLANKVKLLGKRYKNGYSDKAAQERADKPAGQ